VSLLQYLLLFGAGFAGGTINAIAGGATFFTFPAMLAIGISPVAANASNTTALCPGNLVAAVAQRRDLADVRPYILRLMFVGLFGGIAGAVLLLITPDRAFIRLVPWLLLTATLVFALSPRILAAIRARSNRSGVHLGLASFALILVVTIYGGYFGAGLGIMLLAGLTLAGFDDLRAANALKNLLSAFVNGVAVVIFVVEGLVVWPATLVMLAGAVLGGIAGARIATRLPVRLFRATVIAVGTLLTIWYFIQS
jgi:uncharacterized membrane protein YfcA